MTSNFLRSTRNLSSVHSGSGGGWSPLRSSSDPGRGESALRSLLEPWSDCCKYLHSASHWAAMTPLSNFSRGHCGVFNFFFKYSTQSRAKRLNFCELFFFFFFIPLIRGCRADSLQRSWDFSSAVSSGRLRFLPPFTGRVSF